MGISRASRYKHKLTGGRKAVHQKKRKYELARAPANTRIGTKKVNVIRTMGGNKKFRALRLDMGNFAWGSEGVSRKAKINDVTYSPANPEHIRTKVLTKGSVIQIDATNFRLWYEKFYNVTLTKVGKNIEVKNVAADATKMSDSTRRKYNQRQKTRVLDPHIAEQFVAGRLYASVSSRPGQSGRADGYILEGKELDFYLKKMQKTKKK